MKKIIMMAMIMVLGMSMFLTGCNLFPSNQAKYLSAPVVTIELQDKTKITIEKRDLINAYNNYGAQLINNYNYTTEKAVDATIDVLINRELMLHAAKGTVTLGNGDLNDIWTQTYDAVISNLAEYEQTVIKNWKLKDEATLTTDEEEDSKEYKPYEKLADIELRDGQYVIVLKDTNTKVDQNVELYYGEGKEISSVIDAVNNVIANSANKDVLTEAKREYIETLKSNEEGQNLSTKAEEVFEREVKRIRENIEDNKYLEIYEDTIKGDNDVSYITVKQVLKKLSSKMLASYSKYTLDHDAYNTAMLESFKDVNYAVDNNYFFVNHILLKYDETSTTQVANLKTAYKNGTITKKQYEDSLAIEADKIRAKDIATGEETDLNPTQLYNLIQNQLTGVASDKKTEIFKDYIYKYNEDTGNMNADYCYIIGKDDSKMVETFTNVSRELWDNGNGEYGSIGYAISEYGVHIIFYAGEVSNLFTITDPDSFDLYSENQAELADVVNKITTKKLNEFNNKTVFDLVYEELAKDNYSIFENMNMDVLKKDTKITKIVSNYKDMLN